MFQSDLHFDSNVLDGLSSFCSPDLHEEHIQSVKIRAVLSIFLHIKKDMKLSSENFFCLKEYSSIIIPIAKSFQNIWKAFKSWEGSNEESTIEIFKQRVESVPEVYQFIDSVLNCFKNFVKATGQLIITKHVTYDDLDALEIYYEVYKAMSLCVSKVFNEVDIISKKVLSDLKKCYDDCVTEIKKLLVRSPKNYPELAK